MARTPVRFPLVFTVLLLGVALSACIEAENGDDPLSTSTVEGPALRWLPDALDWGTLATGEEAVQTVTLANVGTSDLTLAYAGLSVDSSFDFVPMGDPAPTVLPPSAVIPVEISYAPSDVGEDVGWLELQSDDPLHALVEVPLSGRRDSEPAIAIDPEQLVWGEIDEGTEDTDVATICNDGDATLALGQLTLTGSEAFTLTDDPSESLLEPGDCVDVGVTYAPFDSTPDVADIEFPSNDPQEPAARLLLLGRCS